MDLLTPLSLGRAPGGLRLHLSMDFFHLDSISRKKFHLGNLRKHHMLVMEWCCMCKKSGESPDHLLFPCDFVRELWNLVF
jgi:hypothetical protein